MTYLEQNREILTAARNLTPQQKRILFLLSLGYQNKVIGAALGLTESSIKSHMTQILSALSCTNRTQAALVALCLQNQLKIDDIVGRRRVPADKCIPTDHQIDIDFLGGNPLLSQLGYRLGSGASTF
ncbi:LuxR C-terminal-related transcriptional regulator [Hyphomicrobium sp. LHD-15]|uniref:response regulator transcription factor n=1 Tax=Hyphomicrobium sp. LHD-15 TaxID=3072142 RepID=UPI00280F43CA|nr:LuxR C-terminal-related transcriptional regulator [Hyphomicrobium sp. LHD-15]MDQ8698401.1 LuxR C-terminal-related transcriptional regulator [Hyphomicrobium sp. LHD-15]